MKGLINLVERDILIRLKDSSALMEIITENHVHDRVPEMEPSWPFVMVGAMSMTPRRAAKINDGTLLGAVHAFSRGRFVDDALVETAKDHVGRIGVAIEIALDGTGGGITDGDKTGHVSYLLMDRQLLVDSGEAGAFHWFANVRAKVTSS